MTVGRQRTVVVMTDHGSGEGSRKPLEQAVALLTGAAPVAVDARHFLAGGTGQVRAGPDGWQILVPDDGLVVTPDVLVVYEIPPHRRVEFAGFLRAVPAHVPRSLGLDPRAWHDATDKPNTVRCLRSAGVPHMETVVLTGADRADALRAFADLGGDVWARPAIGCGGRDVFHLTTRAQVLAAREHYASSAQTWMMSRDAGNVADDGSRRQYRVIVLHGRVVRVCEHIQPDPDKPANESQGAASTLVPVDALDAGYQRLAVAATRAVGLPFGGVDLAPGNGGVVFEVNVHPMLDVPGGLESVAVPYVRAHLG